MGRRGLASGHDASNDAPSLDALLAPFLRIDGPRYGRAEWLKCSFEDHVWMVSVNGTLEIDWRVRLPDGSLLTDPCKAELWKSLRSWLVASLHVDSTGGKFHASATKRRILVRTLHCIDYLLLRAETLGLMQNGLSALSLNDLKAIVVRLGTHRVSTSVYEWPKRLTGYLRKVLAQLPQVVTARTNQGSTAFKGDIPAERLTELTEEEIVKAREWLSEQRPYVSRRGARVLISCKRVASELYADTLFGRQTTMPIPHEFESAPEYSVATEYPKVPVRNQLEEGSLYVDIIKVLAMLRSEGLDAPDFRVDDLKAYARALIKPRGRFRTLPQHVVFPAFRQAVEYALEYGEALADSYLAVCTAASKAGQSISTFTSKNDIGPFLTERCRGLGVCRWTIEQKIRKGKMQTLSKNEWYSFLRANAGLWEAIRVLYGAIQLVVGLLSARRIGELRDLMAGAFLDKEETRLLFRNRKSGPGGLRELEARPIPPICVRLLKLLQSLQTGLINAGELTTYTNLFASPRYVEPKRLVSVTASTYHHSLNLFCDWAETPLNEEGKRYYIRQHQLRRFFAMLFFWGGGFGGMDTLRWFLGHTNAEHLWHYITESTPGATIRSVAAEWAAYSVKHATQEAELLSAELAQHFGVADFTVLDEEALVMHLEDLIEEGRLHIEPEFLDNGKAYRIAVILRPQVLQ